MVKEKFTPAQTVWGFDRIRNESPTSEGVEKFQYISLYTGSARTAYGWCRLKQEGATRECFRFEKHLYPTKLEALKAKCKWLEANVKTAASTVEKETTALRESMDLLWDARQEVAEEIVTEK